MDAQLTLRTIYHTTRADFLERVRSYRTLVTLTLAVFFTYVILPPAEASYLSFNIGHLRGVYNSAWVGGVVTVFGTIIFWIPAFLLVQGAIDRDRHTGVGQIIATTPLGRSQYTVGKALSNFVYLAALTGAVFVIAAGIQLLRGEVQYIEPWHYLAPYLFIILPLMALAAAGAVLGDSLAWLGGGRGRAFVLLVWGLLWMSSGGTLAQGMPYLYDGSPQPAEPPLSVSGVPLVFHSMYAAAREQNPGNQSGLFIATLPGGQNINIARESKDVPEDGKRDKGFALETFVWEGIPWILKSVLGGLIWFPVALAVASLAGLFFDRFDPAKQERLPRDEGAASSAPTSEQAEAFAAAAAPAHLTPLPAAHDAGWLVAFRRAVRAELCLMLKNTRWWWYAVAGGLMIAGLLVPVDISRGMLLPLAWIWPFILWSPLGNRETRHNTSGMLFSAAFPLRQLAACWTAGFIVALITGSGVAARLALEVQWEALLAWGVAALFIPSLALALGVWSGTNKAFEGIYLILWYLGPWNKISYLDFMSTTDIAMTGRMPLYYVVLTLVLLVLSVVGRQRQINI
ncbi:MAG: ABC-2 transporter permease [Anaerolineae bacterium]|nr:MAG: ABC-2 transporter permease [Anaerolineae bacterium]